MLSWLERDLTALPAAHAITEPPHYVEPDASARVALEQLQKPGVSRLLVRPVQGGPAQGVIAPMDIVDLVTRPP